MEPQAARREQDDGGERGRPGDTQPCRWQIAGGWRLERKSLATLHFEDREDGDGGRR